MVQKKRTDWFIFDNWTFDNFISADQPFAKGLRSLKTCLLIDKNCVNCEY